MSTYGQVTYSIVSLDEFPFHGSAGCEGMAGQWSDSGRASAQQAAKLQRVLEGPPGYPEVSERQHEAQGSGQPVKEASEPEPGQMKPEKQGQWGEVGSHGGRGSAYRAAGMPAAVSRLRNHS